MTSRCFARIILCGFDYNSQLEAICNVLRINKQCEDAIEEKINKLDEMLENMDGSSADMLIYEREELLERSVFLGAANSMSTVGMLAPFVESIFTQAFQGIKSEIFDDAVPHFDHKRWQIESKKKWDCHYIWDKGSKKKDIKLGIIDLAEAIGLKPLLPSGLAEVLDVLFAYRNAMFHGGFEWPEQERSKFIKRIKKSHWPTNWFDYATINTEPWVVYLTDDFIQYALNTIKQIISSFDQYVVGVMNKNAHRKH